MINRRLINCDFLNHSGFKVGLSNKAKLLYFFFLANADDKGFVGNAKDLAESLDRCEEDYENALFQYKYVDAIHELVEKRLIYEFLDKCGNGTYLIRHWFYHNKQQPFLTTNYMGLLEQVELVHDEYHLKNHEEKKPYKENKIKEKQNKQNLKSNSYKKIYDNDIDTSSNEGNSIIDMLLDDLDNIGKEKK